MLSKITTAGYTLGPITFPNRIIVPHTKLCYGAGLKSGHRTVSHPIIVFALLHQGEHFSAQASTEECTGWIKSLMSFSCGSLQSIFWHYESQCMAIYYTEWDTELGKWFSWQSVSHVDIRTWGCEEIWLRHLSPH